MKKLFFSITFSFIIFKGIVIGQSIDPEEFLKNISVEKTPLYSKNKKNVLFLRNNFGQKTIVNPSELNSIKGATIQKIELVFSDYKNIEEFSQDRLNQDRLLALFHLSPELFNDHLIEWKMIAQTSCKSPEEANKLFHGFAISYRPKPTMESIKKELSDLKKALGDETNNLSKAKFTEELSPLDKNELAIDPKKITKEPSYGETGPMISFPDNFQIYTDQVVAKAFERNEQWKNSIIAADITGSMSPYSAQFFTWLQLHIQSSPGKHYIFFNDGDMTPDDKKQTGKTGGLYDSSGKSYHEIKSKVYEAMRNGYGGDAPENNVEAILKALKIYPDCDQVILIADNWANMRDYSLIKQIKKPVRVIVCGVSYGINTQYLNLARETGGSIHTMESDITDLAKLSEGAVITINKQKYKVLNGKITYFTKKGYSTESAR